MLSQGTRIIMICYTGLKKCKRNLHSLKKFKNKLKKKKKILKEKQSGEKKKNPPHSLTKSPKQNITGSIHQEHKKQNDTVTRGSISEDFKQ